MFKNQYSQSFQKQVVMFSSVIILSEKKMLNIAVPKSISTFSFHNLYDLVHSEVHGEGNFYFTT